MRRADLTGNQFGRLTAIKYLRTDRTPNGSARAIWSCKCDCGETVEVFSGALVNGTVRSCGCLRREITGSLSKTHGSTKTATYETWRGMKERCTNPKHVSWSKYGGRGIAVCDRWLNYENFVADMGERKPGTTLDRIDNDRGYEPDNCRWATTKEQSRNTSRSKLINWNGKTQIAKDWAAEFGISELTMQKRLKKYPLHVVMEAGGNRIRS